MTALERRLELLKNNGLLLSAADQKTYHALQREIDGDGWFTIEDDVL